MNRTAIDFPSSRARCHFQSSRARCHFQSSRARCHFKSYGARDLQLKISFESPIDLGSASCCSQDDCSA